MAGRPPYVPSQSDVFDCSHVDFFVLDSVLGDVDQADLIRQTRGGVAGGGQ